MRLACVCVPQIALQAVLRREPALRQEAVVLADGRGERARVVGLTRAAAQVGATCGMTVNQARTVASQRLGSSRTLRALPASAADTAAAQAALADVGYAFAPRVEAEPARVFLDVGDLRQLYPSAGPDGGANERGIAQALAAQAERVGLAVRVAIASSKAVARMAAEAEPVAVVPAGGERAFLAARPYRLALGPPVFDPAEAVALAEALERWGIRTLGALAALPRREVALRLGEPGARLARLAAACPDDDEPFAPQLPPDAIEETTALEWALYELEPLAFVLRGLIDRALARLAGRQLGCAGLTLRLALEPRGFEVREVTIAAPTRETGPLLELARLALARRPPSAPVTGMSLLVQPARVRAVQMDLLRPTGPAPERLAAILARLSALVGPENVGAPALVDTFREEAVEIRGMGASSAPAPETRRASPPVASESSPHHLGFRRFRPPRAIDVLMGRDGLMALRGSETTAQVLVAAGPYRSSGQWWSADGFNRDYWDVQASDGAVYRLHQDRRDGRWYLDGYYD